MRSYYSGGNLAILLADWTSGEPQPWGDLTVNLGWTVSKDCAFIDVNNLGNDILPWMEKNKLGKPTAVSSKVVLSPIRNTDLTRTACWNWTT